MSLDPVEIKLLEELRHRNSRLFWQHVGLVVVIMLFNHKLHYTHPGSIYPYVITLSCLILRNAIMKWFFYEYSTKRYFLRSIYLLLVTFTGLGWGLLFQEVDAFYGLLTVESLLCLGVLNVLMSGGITAFSSSVLIAAFFMGGMAILPIYTILINHPEMNPLSLLIFGTFLFHVYHTRIAQKFLKGMFLTEAEAIKQKDILQEYIDAMPGIVAVIDKDGTYVMINNYLNGMIKHKILGTKVGATLPNNPVSNLIIEFMKSSLTEQVKEVHAQDLAGENWYMVNLKKISSPQEGIIAAILPINDLVKAKNDLKIQEARSQYAAKLASLGEFSAGIAHEVNNPLTIIEGAAKNLQDVLLENPKDTKTLNLMAGKISDTTKRINKIIKSLKMLSADAVDEPFLNVSFMSIVEPVLEITKIKILSSGIKLSIHEAEEDVALFGNEIQLSQVILNLASNSIDAVQESQEKWIKILYQPTFEWSDILIIDSGPGISKEIQHYIMDPFYTTKSSVQGTGLGLSISKNIVEKHCGTLTLLPDEKNTTFRIRLPRMTPWKS